MPHQACFYNTLDDTSCHAVSSAIDVYQEHVCQEEFMPPVGPSGSRSTKQSMSREQLLALPASITLVTAGNALGIGRTKAHELVRTGQFPTRVLRFGNAYRVPTAEILELLGIDPASPTAPTMTARPTPAA
jgi:hypothetical protein